MNAANKRYYDSGVISLDFRSATQRDADGRCEH